MFIASLHVHTHFSLAVSPHFRRLLHTNGTTWTTLCINACLHTKITRISSYLLISRVVIRFSSGPLHANWIFGHFFFGLKQFVHRFYSLNFYSFRFQLGLSKNRTAAKLQVLLLIISNGLSVYLTYLLYLLQDVCVVCVSMYVVNIIALYLAINRHRVLAKQHSTRASSKSSSSGGAAASAASKKKPKPNKRKAKKEK